MFIRANQTRVAVIDHALLILGRIDSLENSDPRLPFRIGELLYESGRYDDAIESYLRTLEIDPSRAQVFYQLGLAFKATGERHRARPKTANRQFATGSPS